MWLPSPGDQDLQADHELQLTAAVQHHENSRELPGPGKDRDLKVSTEGVLPLHCHKVKFKSECLRFKPSTGMP